MRWTSGVRHAFEERANAGAHRRKGALHRTEQARHLLCEVPLHLLIDRQEEILLGGELVIERPPRDPRAAHDLLCAHLRIALAREQRAGRADELGARRCRPRSLAIDIHTVCM